MLFDSHTHLNFPDFDADREEILKNCQNQKIWMTNIGTDFASSKAVVDLAGRTKEGVYASIGLHPTEDQIFDEEDFAELVTEKVVAIGECGLDYFHEKEEGARKRQKQNFLAQMAFARKHGLPLVIHCRQAYDDLLQILKAEFSGHAAIIHSFTDSWEIAKKFLDLGFYIALNGILLFDKTGRLEEVAKNLPSDRILTETDAPFLSPPPFRGKRNQPDYVRFVAERIAQIRSADYEEVSNTTFENACAVYNIKKQANS